MTTPIQADPRCASPRCPRGERDAHPHSRPAGAGTGTGLCRSCTERLADRLAELPGLFAESEHELAGEGRTWMSPRVSGSRKRRLPIDPRTADVREHALATLAEWAGLVADERRLTALPPRTVPALAGFLGAHLGWLAGHPAAGAAADEITQVAGSLRRVVDPDPVEAVPVGDCPEPGCHGTVSISSIGSAAALRGLVCDAGHSLPPTMWLRLADPRFKKEVAAV
ncbi:OvmZ protein [Streptomyces sp. XH2]|uniref:OvmZ protein n=1 Tax=Streptomyces sp. XH2 TaxID=3412483 RepID=UPI003C7AD370